ncbi:MAG TPA: hypothetical protein VFA43_03015 [Gemmatimonadaceae bacterium]|nr:hypothetical protein [Gemmatimonadaceae bacterium]
MTRFRARLMVLGPFLLAGCVGGKAAFPVDEEGPLPPVSTEERCEAQQQLAHFETGKHPPGMVGGVLFDGTVSEVRAGNGGKQLVSLRIERKLLGAELLSSSTLTLITPAPGAGGVAFREGARYRVYAVPLRGNFYTWQATGSYDLDKPDCPR